MRARDNKNGMTTKQAWGPNPNADPKTRDYQPEQFADGDMSQLIQENQMLKAKVLCLSLYHYLKLVLTFRKE